MSPDQRRVLVSKDVGGERWAITRDLSSGSVSGNVFFPGGGNPRFVWCDPASSQSDPVELSCSGSQSCLLAPCTAEAWAFLANISLPASFFQPRTASAALSCSATAQLTVRAASPPSGVQLSPGQGVALVSKDVGAERWAIARNADDGSITGNVFFPGGGDPRFVYCRETGHSGGNLSLACDGADACGTSCASSDWTFIADVTLPEGFFRPKDKAPVDELEARILETLGDDASGFRGVSLAADYGYSYEQILHAASDGRLEASGLIRLRSGAIEEPAGAAHGLFLETPARPSAAGSVRADKRSVDDARFRLLRDHPEFASVRTFGIILKLINEGYSPEQIIPAIFTNSIRKLPQGLFDPYENFQIVDENERRVVPDEYKRDLLGAPSNPSPSPTPTATPQRTPTPTPAPLCGNGRIDPDEECDGANLAHATCTSVGFAGGTLRCTARCTFDVTGCVEGPTPTPPASPTPTPPEPHCGNGIKESGEACDGTDYGGATCDDYGFASGQLRCRANCTVDTSACSDLCPADSSAVRAAGCCGDGVAQSDEQCDGGDLKGKTCASLGFTGGRLACTASCGLDTSGCSVAPTPTPFVCPGDICPDGSCVPEGADCCGGGRYCPAGKICVGDDKCCPGTLPHLCGNFCISEDLICCGTTYCPAGSVCVDGGCCPASQPQACPDGTCTIAGAECCGNGTSCIPGFHCVPGGCAPN